MLTLQRLSARVGNRQSAGSISIRFPVEFVRSSVSLTVEKRIELFHAADNIKAKH